VLTSPRFRYVYLAVLSWVFSAVNLLSGEHSQFVEIKDREFRLAGQPYRFVGVNYWYAPLLGLQAEPGDRKRLIRELDTLKRLGLTNLRILALAERSSASQLRQFAQDAPGQFSEAWFDGLDFALAEMDKRGMKAVLCLTNYWNWSGGLPQYLSWAGGGPVVPDEAPWPERNRYVIDFYGHAEAEHLAALATEKLVKRRNRYSGRNYREDPTIMSWQICNEARPGTWEQTAAIRVSMIQWFARASEHLRALHVRQLISSGCEGVFGCNGDEDLFRKINALPQIDYVTAHLWPENWAWYNPRWPDETYSVTEALSIAFLNQHIQIATDLGKPLVLEEFGIARDGASYSPQATTTSRDRFLALVGETWLASIKRHGAFQGFNVWSWSGEAEPREDWGVVWNPGEPMIGDNPSEPQGWYSISEADRETVNLLTSLAAQGGFIARHLQRSPFK